MKNKITLLFSIFFLIACHAPQTTNYQDLINDIKTEFSNIDQNDNTKLLEFENKLIEEGLYRPTTGYFNYYKSKFIDIKIENAPTFSSPHLFDNMISTEEFILNKDREYIYNNNLNEEDSKNYLVNKGYHIRNNVIFPIEFHYQYTNSRLYEIDSLGNITLDLAKEMHIDGGYLYITLKDIDVYDYEGNQIRKLTSKDFMSEKYYGDNLLVYNISHYDNPYLELATKEITIPSFEDDLYVNTSYKVTKENSSYVLKANNKDFTINLVYESGDIEITTKDDEYAFLSNNYLERSFTTSTVLNANNGNDKYVKMLGNKDFRLSLLSLFDSTLYKTLNNIPLDNARVDIIDRIIASNNIKKSYQNNLLKIQGNGFEQSKSYASKCVNELENGIEIYSYIPAANKGFTILSNYINELYNGKVTLVFKNTQQEFEDIYNGNYFTNINSDYPSYWSTFIGLKKIVDNL